ncbi:MAG: cob(I)yrinic acid a,c-diamide adenosyltransferase [Akkermansia sp.]|nr:cob(I)yrinic acid a,c-diamide adenosyltransferase [Akkermansia sp.]
MSVITKRGDDGWTDLMFGKRSPKSAPRLEAYGTVDELNSALGAARAAGVSAPTEEKIDGVQARLVGLMGELATLEEDLPAYDEKGYARVRPEDVSWLEEIAGSMEEECSIRFQGWARPGRDASLASALLDLARAVCRRAERRVAVLRERNELSNISSALFLNRLSDLLWILARYEALSKSQP